MKAAFPSLVMGEERDFPSLAAGVEHFEARGFRHFDSAGEWVLLRNGVLEAMVSRTHKKFLGAVLHPFRGSVIQLAEA